ncbi:putative asparagine-rich zinc finger protein AZF1 [Halenospora varia]|nr:putative asparagine-rich zinc finger protein AZF1 [Halenospora varia]
MQQNNLFSFAPYTGAGQNGIIPAFANYIQQRPLPRSTQSDTDGSRGMSYARNTRQGYVEELHSASPTIKAEPQWNSLGSSPSFVSANTKTVTKITPTNGCNEVDFGTEVDTLMKAIQAKSKSTKPQTTSSVDQSKPVVGVSGTSPYVQAASQVGAYASGESSQFSPKGREKHYHCTVENCTKSFYQKTLLDIHDRAHTGAKPYPCKEPGCGRSFSQLGNLKTHERRHTGERPYNCEICGKKFAHRGNVRTHKIVHDKSKPFICRLDDCGKGFTQLGNLKSHQNKFHFATIRDLTSRFASIKDGDIVHAADKELWEYFANLYKNSNKGIKGRGKDRKVGSNKPYALNSRMRKSKMFDVGEESQPGHGGSGSASSGYDDAPLAFGYRMY